MAKLDKKKGARRSARDRAGQAEQSQRFIEAARELGADQSEEAFNEALRKIAHAPDQRSPVNGCRPIAKRGRPITTKRLKEPLDES